MKYQPGLLLGLTLLATPIPAQAQETANQAIKNNNIKLMDVVTITSQKIETTAQDTKESVAVTTGERIEQQGFDNLEEVINQTASISTTSGRGFRIRGIDSGSIGTTRGELSTVYIDGVALTGWVKNEGPQQMWDIKQVEIFRGPQSTNFGRNSLAGAISIKTMDPVYENTARVRGGIGAYGTRELSGMGNISIVDNVAALRVNYDLNRIDGFSKNVTRDDKDFGFRRQETIRAKLLLEPLNDLKITTSFRHVNNSYGSDITLVNDPDVRAGKRIAVANEKVRHPLKANIGSATIEYKINDEWAVKAISAAMGGRRKRFDDFDRFAEDGGTIARVGKDSNFSQELRVNYSNDWLRGSSGLYFITTSASNNNNTDATLRLRDFRIGQLIDAGIYPELFSLRNGACSKQVSDNYAIFTEWQVDITDQIELGFGARFEHEVQKYKFQNTASTNETLPNPDLLPDRVAGVVRRVNTQLGAISTTGPEFRPKKKFSAFLPHGGITFHWNENINSSFFVKRGYRAGGAEVTSLNTFNEFSPEHLTNYEISTKAYLGNKGTAAINAYYGIWKNQQVFVNEIQDNNSFVKIENAGKSKIYGVEADLTYQHNRNLNTYFSAAYNKTKFVKFDSRNGDFSGNTFPLAPKFTLAAGGHYRFDNGFYINANIRYEDKAFANNANTIEVDSRTVVNARAGYMHSMWQLQVYVNNLFGETYKTRAFTNKDARGLAPLGVLGPPRVIGARFDFYL